jgi:hypothetical protein
MRITDYFSNAATAGPLGLPSPVHASQPGDAEKLPLFPLTMSFKADGVA